MHRPVRARILFVPTQGFGRFATVTLGFAVSRFQRWYRRCGDYQYVYYRSLVACNNWIVTPSLISSAAGAGQKSPGWKSTRQRATEPWVWNGFR
jgi:hypothetical protein